MTVMTRRTSGIGGNSHRRHNPVEHAPEETAPENGGLGLPIEPDEGTILIPDDERVPEAPF